MNKWMNEWMNKWMNEWINSLSCTKSDRIWYSGKPSMLTLSFSFLSNATDKPDFLKECIMESFIFPNLGHASQTDFAIRTFHWLEYILPSTYWSRFLSNWSSNKRAYFIFKCFIYQYPDNLDTRCTFWWFTE